MLDGVINAPATLPPGKRPSTHCTEDWVSPTTGLDGCGKYRPPPNEIRSLDRQHTFLRSKSITEWPKRQSAVMKMHTETRCEIFIIY